VKICCITSFRIPSKAANSIQVMKVGQALSQLEHEVVLFTPGHVHTPWKDLAALYGLALPFEVIWLPAYASLKRYDFAVKAVQQASLRKADLIYTWLPQAGLLGVLLGFPVVLEIHDRPTGRLGGWLLRRMAELRGEKRFAVITRALEQALQHEFGIPFKKDEVVIAPNGVDLQRFEQLPAPPEARRQLNLPQQLTAVYSGHFYAGRGMDLLVGLAQRFPNIHFLWVGGQPDAVESYREVVHMKGLTNVTLTGFVENQRLPLFQAAGEILLMPYERQIAGSGGGNSADICSPMKMFEYLACGRAILTSDLPVLHEVLNDGNARFCPPEDVEAWTRALDDLFRHTDVCGALGQQARVDAERYTWVARAHRILANWAL
jgi:glycosyltransferase involved in cell wall biosynthesis